MKMCRCMIVVKVENGLSFCDLKNLVFPDKCVAAEKSVRTNAGDMLSGIQLNRVYEFCGLRS